MPLFLRLKDMLQMLRQNPLWILYILLVLGIFLGNALHESYPDEFDNILGGWYILHGRLPFIGFFTHHGPVAYFLAAIIEIVSGQSFVRFRIVYTLFLLVWLFWSYRFLMKRFGQGVRFLLVLIPLIGLSLTYVWGQMFLADNLAAFLLLLPYLLLLLSMRQKRPLTLPDIACISITGSLTLFSSLTYTYLIGVLYLTTLLAYFVTTSKRKIDFSLIKPLAILAAPIAMFALYLFITGSLRDYYEQNIVFNAKYYIYNYPRPEDSGHINPVRFLIIIANNFFYSFFGLLQQVKDFNFGFPFNPTLAFGSTIFIILLLLRRQYAISLFILLTLIYATARTDPLRSQERDYQSAVYFIFSALNTTLALQTMRSFLEERQELWKKIIIGFLLTILMVYVFFTVLFVFARFESKAFSKYMGTAPLIYDRPLITPYINMVVGKDDFMMILPFAFEDLFYAQGKIPTKYHILLPEFHKIPEVQQEVIADVRRNKPKVIFFDHSVIIRGQILDVHASYFVPFLQKDYVALSDYREGDIKYTTIDPGANQIDLGARLYMEKTQAPSLIQVYLQKGIVKPESSLL